MKIIFNSYNTIGAGPSNVSKFILKSLAERKNQYKKYFIIPKIYLFKDEKSSRHLKIFKIPVMRNFLKYVFRGFYDMFLFPAVTLILNPTAVIVLANYSPMKVCGKKIVFMRHPFLVDKCPNIYNDPKTYIIERFRKIIFILTLMSTDVLVVQSSYMKQALLNKFGRLVSHMYIYILPNPISNLIDLSESDVKKCGKDHNDKIVLYISRYYPHKNHQFLMRLAETYQDEFRREKIKFYITIDSSEGGRGARHLLNEIIKRNLDDIVCNLGELPNAALAKYYRTAQCLFFPSTSETFGNPLIEAMAFGLPIIVPDLNYAKEACKEAGIYYKANEIDDAFDKIMTLFEDQSIQEDFSWRSRLRIKNFSTTDQWVDEVFSLASRQL
ncbi:glycosyltransferase [bacterium]|nr:glycosyltransferase [bacterium]